MNGWRKFTETDWNGFAGAWKFADGGEPSISEQFTVDGHEAFAVLDRHGAQLMVLNEDYDMGACYDSDENPGAVAWLCSREEHELTSEQLETAGFRNLFG